MKRVDTKNREVLLRGLRKRCPHCGGGPLFERGVVLHEHCSECRLKLVRNSGDTWGFLLFIDRAAFILPIVAALYFGLQTVSWYLFAVFTLAVAVAMVLTTPRRYGLCVALDYLTRVYWGDPSDPLPDLPPAEAGPGGAGNPDGTRRQS